MPPNTVALTVRGAPAHPGVHPAARRHLYEQAAGDSETGSEAAGSGSLLAPGKPRSDGAGSSSHHEIELTMSSVGALGGQDHDRPPVSRSPLRQAGFPIPGQVGGHAAADNRRDLSSAGGNDDDEEELVLSKAGCFLWLTGITIFIALLSEAIMAAIKGAALALRIPLPFLTTIVLPIFGNAAEHASAVIFAAKNRIEISLGVAVGSATQVCRKPNLLPERFLAQNARAQTQSFFFTVPQSYHTHAALMTA